MKKNDSMSWIEKRIGELFDIHPTKSYKAINAKLLDGGDYPVVVNSAYNNGIGGYSSFKPTERGEMITFSDTVDANTIFYQHKPFVGYPHVQGLYPIGEYADRWNKHTLLFFTTVFKRAALSKGFDYGNKFRRDIAIDLTVKLPVMATGEPDFAYMESYMRSILQKSEASLASLRRADKSKRGVSTRKWGPYKIGELFDVVKGTRLTKANMREGDINFISASSFNNGIAAQIANYEHIHPANTMTVSYNGSDIGRTFYQEEPFWASDDVNVLYPKFTLTRNIALFLAPLIKAAGGSHVYKNKWRQEDMINTDIMLPATKKNDPDWNYMDTYMNEIQTRANKYIDVLSRTLLIA